MLPPGRRVRSMLRAADLLVPIFRTSYHAFATILTSFAELRYGGIH